jgi:putative oxidoreductase
MKISLDSLLASSVPSSTILIRLMVGGVFLSEGIQKFLDPASRGAGRFERIGLPAAEFLGPFVGATEILCGALVLVGLLTRLASVPLIATMLVAIVTTKVPILLGSGFWGLQLRELSSYGFWSMAHEARTDFAMLLGSIFLLVVGAGPLALDAALQRRRRP